MANYTDTLGFDKNSAAYPANGNDRLAWVSTELDFAAIIAARSAASATALQANDTLQVIHVPANTIVIAGAIEVTSVESTNTTATFDLGWTGGDVDEFVDGAVCNALGVSSLGLIVDPTNYVTAADTLDLLLLTAVPTDAVIKVKALMFNMNH